MPIPFQMFISRIKPIWSQDPQWGRGSGNNDNRGNGQDRGGQDGPPDLDELWRDFNRRVNGLFGRDGGRGGRPPIGGGGGFNPSPRGIGIGAGAIAIGVLVLWGASGFYIVQEGQTAAVARFGEFKYLTDQAGFKWRLPSPIESHEMVNVQQLRQITVGYRSERGDESRDSLMLTADENMIDLQFAVQYRVSDAKQYLYTNRRPDDVVNQAAESAMREVVGKSKSDAVLYENKEAAARDARELMQAIIDRYSVGITVVDVTIQNVQPPEEVQAAFNDAVKAGQDSERLKNEGQAYANDVVPKARGTAARLMQEAEGYKERVVAQATGEAARFKSVLGEYTKAPAVTRERLYIDTMQQILSNTTKVLVDSKANSGLLYLPLEKLIAQAGLEAANRPMNSSPATETPAAELPKLNRDAALRNRDREVR